MTSIVLNLFDWPQMKQQTPPVELPRPKQSLTRNDLAGHITITESNEQTVVGTKDFDVIQAGLLHAATDKELTKEFRMLVNQWEKDTEFHSSLGVKFTHPAYQRILGMGTPALPLILSELKRKPGHWFYALNYISGKDYAAEAGAQSFAEAREAWLKWGHDNGYI
jgi:hypothetical protein